MLKVLVLIAVVCICVIPILLILQKQGFLYKNDNIIFVSTSYMNNVINTSPYFQRMSALDLLARKVKNKDEYKQLYKSSLKGFDSQEKQKLIKHIAKIDTYLKIYKNISSIPWKLSKVSIIIEQGYPHTLKDVIVLSESFFNLPDEQQALTLLHEKIHVYQRIFPIETEELVLNFLDFQIKKENYDLAIMKRNNPDLNDLVYGKDNFYIMQMYNSFSPNSISDSRAVKVDCKSGEIQLVSTTDLEIPIEVTQLEHPMEIMACFIPYIILQKQMDTKYIKWMNLYL